MNRRQHGSHPAPHHLLQRHLLHHQQHTAADLARHATAPQPGLIPTDPACPTPAGGDPMQLRGIPVIARGVGGTSPGTAPHHIRVPSHSPPR